MNEVVIACGNKVVKGGMRAQLVKKVSYMAKADHNQGTRQAYVHLNRDSMPSAHAKKFKEAQIV